MPYFPPIGEEEDVFSRLATSRAQRAAFSASATPELASSVGQMATYYPWMPAGASLSLAKAGVAPDHPVARAAAHAAAKRKSKSGLGWHSIGDAVKATARIGFTALESPLQEVTHAIGNVASYGEGGKIAAGAGTGALVGGGLGSVVPVFGTAIGAAVGAGVGGLVGAVAPSPQGHADWRPASTGAIALGRAVTGKPVDLGTGYLPGGAVRTEHEVRSRDVSVAGHGFTPGRFLATTVAEPGSTPYSVMSGLVDIGVALKADPAAAVQSKLAEARKASRLFASDAGLVEGVRKTVLPEVADSWLASKDGRKVVTKLAETDGVDDIWKASNKKIPVAVAVELADAKTPEAVSDVIRSHAGIALREKPTLGGVGVTVRKRLEGVRLAQQMPGHYLHLDDMDQAVEQLDRFQKNAKLPLDVVKANNEALARAAGAPEKYQVVVNTVMRQVRDELVSHGVDPSSAGAARSGMTRVFRDATRRGSAYFVNEIGEDMAVPGAVIGGSTRTLPTPHLYSEFVNQAIPLPDARVIRRATGKLAPIFKVPGVEASEAAADFFMQSVWKPFQLLRGAWTVRVVGEEQIRMAAAGLDSVFNHPLSAIARIVATDAPYKEGLRYAASNAAIAVQHGAARTLERVGISTERGALGLTGEHLADSEAAREAMAKGSAGFVDRSMIRTKYKDVYRRGDPAYITSWRDELAQLHTDPVASHIAREGSLDDAKDWFWSGPGQKFRKEMAAQRPDLAHRVVADQYMDSVLERIKIKTGDDPALLDAIGTGHIDGHPIREAIGDPAGAEARLGSKAAAGVGPEWVKGDVMFSREGRGAVALENWNGAVDTMMSALMSRPSNYLSRSPAFSQFYWQRAEELLPFMDDAAKAEAIRAAGDAGLSRAQLRRLAGSSMRGTGELTLEQADTVAKAFAIDSTKGLLYDLSNKSQWADAARLAFPFGEAWKEILGSWGRLGVENYGKPLRRLQQGVEGARGAGWFHTDPQTGEEVFNYPGSQFVTGAITGVPTPLQGRVASLNLFSNNPLMPGVGPVVSIPVGHFVPDKPGWQEAVRSFALPFGQTDTSEGFVEGAVLPAWFSKVRKAMASPESDRLFANTVMDMASYLVSTGDYSTATPADQERLSDAATHKARQLYLIRAVAQWGAPAAPSPQAVARDKDGHLTTAFKLTDEFRKLQQADYTTAVDKFLDTFGENALLYMQPKSQGGVTPTDQLHDWVGSHADLVRRYRSTYGFFAPEGGEFSFPEYERQFSTGERKGIKPEEAVRLANHRVATMVYNQAKDKVGPNPDGDNAAWLRDVQETLAEEYPGYEPARYDAAKIPRMMAELQTAVKDKRLANTEAGRALKVYLSARDKAQAEAKARGRATFARSNDTADLRDWLRSIADDLTTEHPTFARMWDGVLSREMRQDEAPTPADNQEEAA